jgi:chromosome segregation protein
MLREFADETQFIVITHSKTTMAMADMLHGVTQRESGVSIRVTVNLDDVASDGRILDSAGSAG